jgi:hypothetical protein
MLHLSALLRQEGPASPWKKSRAVSLGETNSAA